MIQVVNVRGLKPAEDRVTLVYVGRRCRAWNGSGYWPGHVLANPYRLRASATLGERAECLLRYREWLVSSPRLVADLSDLWEDTDNGRLALGCWCHPEPCHADLLAELLNRPYFDDAAAYLRGEVL